MERETLRELLGAVRRGDTTPDDALEELARLPFVDTPGGDGRVDIHRALRQGLPEVIYGPGKTAHQIVEIVRTLRAAG